MGGRGKGEMLGSGKGKVEERGEGGAMLQCQRSGRDLSIVR